MQKPPTSKKPETVRLTIPVTVEVHEAFTRIAKASKQPIGRAMGQWLEDTVDAANYLAQTLEKARSAPKLVAQELHAYALGLTDETGDLMDRIRAAGREKAAGGAQRERGGPAAATPPSNTGVTNTNNKPKRGSHGTR